MIWSHPYFLFPFFRHAAFRILFTSDSLLSVFPALVKTTQPPTPANSCMAGNLSIITIVVPISSWKQNVGNYTTCLSLRPFLPPQCHCFHSIFSTLWADYNKGVFIHHAGPLPSAEECPKFSLWDIPNKWPWYCPWLIPHFTGHDPLFSKASSHSLDCFLCQFSSVHLSNSDPCFETQHLLCQLQSQAGRCTHMWTLLLLCISNLSTQTLKARPIRSGTSRSFSILRITDLRSELYLQNLIATTPSYYNLIAWERVWPTRGHLRSPFPIEAR